MTTTATPCSACYQQARPAIVIRFRNAVDGTPLAATYCADHVTEAAERIHRIADNPTVLLVEVLDHRTGVADSLTVTRAQALPAVLAAAARVLR